MLDKLLTEYVERFDKNFPICCLMGTPETEIIKMLEECLKNGVPYKLDNCDPTKVLY